MVMAKEQNQQQKDARAAAKAAELKKTKRAARVNNTIVGAAAGSFLGGQVHGGASGYKGARVGALVGGLYGALSNPKRRAEIEKLQTASFSTPASRYFGSIQDRAEQRDRVRTGAAVAAGAAGTAAGVYGAVAARKASKQAAQFTPQAVVQAAGQQASSAVKGKVKRVAKEYFPTFTKAGKKVAEVMKRKVLLTPARKVFWFEAIELGNKEQLKDVDRRTYADPLKVAAGMQGGYFRSDPDGRPIKADVPVMHAQVVNAAVRKAAKVSKWSGRAGGLAKDASAVVRGKPREKDASGRSKKREWEKSWFKEGARRVAIAGGILGGAQVLKKNPTLRRKVVKGMDQVKKKVNKVMPDTYGLSARFVTPASRLYQFDGAAADAGWDVRDPRGRSARVFAPGAGKRDRREKRWYEKAENERKLWKTAVVAAGLAGVAGGRMLKKKSGKVPVVKSTATKGGYYANGAARNTSNTGRWQGNPTKVDRN